MLFQSLNPATGRRIQAWRAQRPGDVERLLARATVAQRAWRAWPIARRAAALRRLGRALLAARDELAPLATAEMGKPIAQARAEIEKSALLCSYYARHGAALLADERPVGAPPQARVTFEPLGTVLAIMPWNFPFWQALRAAVPALIGGNAVLLKPAATVVGCSQALEKIFDRAGLPRGVFQLLLADNAAIARVIADRRVHAVTLTGSTAAGKNVAALAGAAMKPGVFELGGSDPALVLADADIPRAAEICAQSRLLNSGQSCVCAKRFIVARPVLADFERQLVARMAARRAGDPADPATEVGPLARADLRATLQEQVERSVRLGARVLLGGAPTPGRGFFYPPTVLTGVRPGMPAFDEELFGPVAAIVAVRDESEAVKLANATPYGLAATVFTRSRSRAQRLARELESGAIFINDFVRSAPELPFGGVKESGHGRELGPWGARAFVNVKTVWEA
ncbi:MAG: NAD-dependent succinate-semialdehyde dehydrogenase [Opitutaceae bacterium]|nr:NAD-dependent succinate-semialdehyde dehydrogenase [Opitutaceae bacterium]